MRRRKHKTPMRGKERLKKDCEKEALDKGKPSREIYTSKGQRPTKEKKEKKGKPGRMRLQTKNRKRKGWRERGADNYASRNRRTRVKKWFEREIGRTREKTTEKGQDEKKKRTTGSHHGEKTEGRTSARTEA